jgi:hypothetical protein
MKLATFLPPHGSARPGIVIGQEGGLRVMDLQAAAVRAGAGESAPATVLQLIESGDRALDVTRRIVERTSVEPDLSYPIGDVTVLAPVPEPPQMRDFSVFPGHIRGAPAGMQRIGARKKGDEAAAAAARPLDDVPQVYRERPVYYITNRFSVSGTNNDVVWPEYSTLMDFELEFGVFLSKSGRGIGAEKAREHIFGYTIYNDFSARDTQFEEMQGMLGPAKGKSFDAGNVLGPWIVTADEIPDPYNLAMRARVNGEVWIDSSAVACCIPSRT